MVARVILTLTFIRRLFWNWITPDVTVYRVFVNACREGAWGFISPPRWSVGTREVGLLQSAGGGIIAPTATDLGDGKWGTLQVLQDSWVICYVRIAVGGKIAFDG